MKISLGPCAICTRENLAAGTDVPPWVLVPVRQDQIYVRECERGHKTVTCYQHQPFEMLHLAGLNALVDGYFRDAVTSFVACLERFYAHYAEEVFHHLSIPEDEVRRGLSFVNLSEREFGLFVATHLLATKRAPRNADVSKVRSRQFKSYRNDVIHKGHLPSKEEAYQVGTVVFDYIREVCSGTPFMLDVEHKKVRVTSDYMHMKLAKKLNSEVDANTFILGYQGSGQGGGTVLPQAIWNPSFAPTIEQQVACVIATRASHKEIKSP